MFFNIFLKINMQSYSCIKLKTYKQKIIGNNYKAIQNNSVIMLICVAAE